MPDALHSEPAFKLHIAQPAPVGDAGVIVRERADYALAIVMARRGMTSDLVKRVAAWGIALPKRPIRDAQGTLAFLALGPERWLATLDNGANTPDGGNAWSKSLARDLAGCASIADQTDGYAVLQVGGRKARAMLAKGVSMDLHPRAFRPGDVAATQIAHMGVVLWQLDDRPTYEIACFRSLAGSFWHWLTASAEEFGLAVASSSTATRVDVDLLNSGRPNLRHDA